MADYRNMWMTREWTEKHDIHVRYCLMYFMKSTFQKDRPEGMDY